MLPLTERPERQALQAQPAELDLAALPAPLAQAEAE